MGRDLALVLTGAAIALVSSLITAITQHLLSLRAQRIRKQLEEQEKASQRIRDRLSEGMDIHLDVLRDRVFSESELKKLFIKLCCAMVTREEYEEGTKALTIIQKPESNDPEPEDPPLLKP